MNERLSFKMQV